MRNTEAVCVGQFTEIDLSRTSSFRVNGGNEIRNVTNLVCGYSDNS